MITKSKNDDMKSEFISLVIQIKFSIISEIDADRMLISNDPGEKTKQHFSQHFD